MAAAHDAGRQSRPMRRLRKGCCAPPRRRRYDRAWRWGDGGGLPPDARAEGRLCPTLAATEACARYFGWEAREPAPGSVQENRRTFPLALDAGVPICMGGDVGVYAHGENWLEMERCVAPACRRLRC